GGMRAGARRAARIPRPRGARLPGARRSHRLWRAPEGGVLVRRPVRDAPPLDGMGRHRRARREHARGRRPRPPRRRSRGRTQARGPAAVVWRRQSLGEDRGGALYASAVMTDVAIVGAGYVGVPLAQVFAEAGKSVVLFDVQPDVVTRLNRGESHIEDVPSEVLAPLVERGLRATTDFDELGDADAILVAVPTPLSKQREPDLSYVDRASGEIAPRLRPGQLVVLESSTYPGTTLECVLPFLQPSCREVASDLRLVFTHELL